MFSLLNALSERQNSKPLEYKVSFDSPWKRRLFVALCYKHGLRTYRYHRQRYSSTCVRPRKDFMEEVLWPEYTRYSKILEELVEDIMQDLISKIYHVQEEETVIVGELS